jgi:hypothetical protein
MKEKRSHRQVKRHRHEPSSHSDEISAMDVDGAVTANHEITKEHGSTRPLAEKRSVNAPQPSSFERPQKPQILEHLVMGINETIKSLEQAIDDFKLTLLLMSDALNGSLPSNPLRYIGNPKSTLLPTAPVEEESSDKTAEIVPLEWIIIPLQSINPQSLVSPIPQYCATYTALVYQHQQISKAIKSRLKEVDWHIMGLDRDEIRVITLGKVEGDLAGLVGLRRLACLGIRVGSSSSMRELY